MDQRKRLLLALGIMLTGIVGTVTLPGFKCIWYHPNLSNSFVQFGFAAGARIGGVVVGGLSIMAITWFDATSLVFAVIVAAFSCRRTKTVLNSQLSN